MAAKKKKNIGWKLLIGAMLLILVFFIGLQIKEWWIARKAHFASYKAFGIELPTQYEIHGIDVSKYQQTIDWERVQAMKVENIKIGFAFIKATEGNGNRDAQFVRNWKRSKEAGLTRGAYHFFLPTKSGKTQAENFIENVMLEPGDLPPVLDVEQTYGVPANRIVERVKEFLNTVEEHYGVKPIIYTNVDFYEQYLKVECEEYPLWVAHYLQKERPRIARPWHFWQHSETGRVNGILSKVDFNVFSGDSAAFRSLLLK